MVEDCGKEDSPALLVISGGLMLEYIPNRIPGSDSPRQIISVVGEEEGPRPWSTNSLFPVDLDLNLNLNLDYRLLASKFHSSFPCSTEYSRKVQRGVELTVCRGKGQSCRNLRPRFTF